MSHAIAAEAGAVAVPKPKKVVVVLLDSLNRHLLGSYGGTEFATPNLDRLAARSVRFQRHYTGSLPCMPARHDILCGNLDFPWRPWGSIEIWEEPITVPLRRAGVATVLVTDHPHLFEVGGENYHCDFTAWDYQRGHESDPWKTRPDATWVGAPHYGRGWMPYDNSRGWFRDEQDFPGPRTMAAAADWLETDAAHHDRFFLLVDEFDPHEPFDTPEPYASMYDPGWEGSHLIWPPYEVGAVERGILSPEQARQIRANYGGKLTMIDHWLGRVLDAFEHQQLWDDTALILCTDHGHFLGEKDIFGKPASPLYETLGHIPLLIAWPGVAAGESRALTTSVDIFATLADVFGASVRQQTHGQSLVPILTGERASVRDWVLTGVWGREMHLVDASRKYCRAPVEDNFPLSMWSNRWSTMPLVPNPELKLPLPDSRAFLDRMPGSSVPVLRQPFAAGDALPYWAYAPPGAHHLWDLDVDPTEEEDRAGTDLERELIEELREALRSIDAPRDHFERLGIG